MPSMNVDPFGVYLPTSEAPVGGAPATGTEQVVDIAVSNTSSALVNCRVGVTNGTITIWLMPDKDIAAKDRIDVWYQYSLTPGWQFIGRASDTNAAQLIVSAKQRII